MPYMDLNRLKTLECFCLHNVIQSIHVNTHICLMMWLNWLSVVTTNVEM